MHALTQLQAPETNEGGRNPCILCGKEIKPGTGKLVVTEQGEHPIGPSCKRKARDAGFELIDDWREAGR